MFRIFRRMRAEYKEEEEIIGKSGDYLRWRKSIWYDEQKNKEYEVYRVILYNRGSVVFDVFAYTVEFSADECNALTFSFHDRVLEERHVDIISSHKLVVHDAILKETAFGTNIYEYIVFRIK